MFGRRKRPLDDLQEEIRSHLELEREELEAQGVLAGDAADRARRRFGNVTALEERFFEHQRVLWCDHLGQDVRHTLRTLRNSPGFALVASLSLALGIGANTAVFGVVDAILLHVLPVHEPTELVFVQTVGTAGRDGPPYPYFELLRREARSFTALAAFSPSAIELTTDRGRELARGVWVSGNFYEALGVHAIVGRILTSTDDSTAGVAAGGQATVISEAYWRQRFGGDPAVVGRTVQLFEHTATIVGVLPSETMSLEPGVPVDVAAPMALSDRAKLLDRTSLWLQVVGRLRHGATAEQARAEADGLFQGYFADIRMSAQLRQLLFQRIELAPAGQGLGGLRRELSSPLAALMAMAALVLLAACLNLASLLAARATARQREWAVRLALGAGRVRLARQALTEALVLVAAGAVWGIAAAYWAERVLAAHWARDGKMAVDLSLNLHVLLFTAGIALASSVLLALAPAWRAARADPACGLQAGSRAVAGSRSSLRLGRALVVAQVTVSLVLLAGAGLFLRTLRGLTAVDLGFRREGLLTIEVTPERDWFGTSRWLQLQDEVVEHVLHLPGVRSAGWATMTPLSGRDRGATVEVPGFVPRTETDGHIHLAAVSPDYFETLGMPLLGGRRFTAGDRSGATRVAVLNQTAGRFYFGERGPLGRTLRFTNYPAPDLVYEVVGVVKDTKHDSVREPSPRFVYLPIAQSVDRINRLALAVRCSGDPLSWAAPVQQEIRRAGPTLLLTKVTTMERQLDQALGRERLVAALATLFGVAALLLACIGLYGLLAYTVARRTAEIGIRLALGSTRRQTVWLILREALALAGVGVLLGVPFVGGLGWMTRTLLFGVGSFDAVVIAGASLLILLVMTGAAIGPSRRASRLDPMVALRAE